MSFIKGAFLGPAFGLIDGKKGAASNLGPSIGGAAFGGTVQKMIDGPADPGNNGGAGMTPLSGRPRLGRGSTSLSV